MLQLGPNLRGLMRRKLSLCLVVLQLSLALGIVSNLSFVVKEINWVQNLPVGFDMKPLLAMLLRPADAKGVSYSQVQSDLARLAQLPDVASASAIRWAPLSHQSISYPVATLADAQAPQTQLHSAQVSPAALTTLNLSLVAGRDFTEADMALDGAEPQRIIISQAAAKALFINASDALGKMVYHGKQAVEVIGVTQDWSGFTFLPMGRPELTAFLPAFESSASEWRYIVRSRTPSPSPELLEAIRNILEGVYKSSLLLEFEPIVQLHADSFIHQRVFRALFLVLLVFLCFVVALAIGGQALFWVNQQKKNLGIHRALGATRPQIIGLVLEQHILMALPGLLIGTAISLGLSRLICKVLPEFPVLPPLFLAVTAAGLLLLILAAAAWPAWRAGQVAPSLATRSL